MIHKRDYGTYTQKIDFKNSDFLYIILYLAFQTLNTWNLWKSKPGKLSRLDVSYLHFLLFMLQYCNPLDEPWGFWEKTITSMFKKKKKKMLQGQNLFHKGQLYQINETEINYIKKWLEEQQPQWCADEKSGKQCLM